MALIYATAADAGNREAAKEMRTRVRRDMGLDTLDLERREATLELVCDRAVFELDLEEVCTEAMEQLAAESADLAEPLSPDILRPLEHTVRLIAGTRLLSGGGGGPEERNALARLQVVLEDYPEQYKSSEHIRIRAETFLKGLEQIEALRKATFLDPGNLAARCGLAKSLERTSPDEAWSIYADLAADPTSLPAHCDPEFSMRYLRSRGIRLRRLSLQSHDSSIRVSESLAILSGRKRKSR